MAILPPPEILRLAYEHYERASSQKLSETEIAEGLKEFEELLREDVSFF